MLPTSAEDDAPGQDRGPAEGLDELIGENRPGKRPRNEQEQGDEQEDGREAMSHVGFHRPYRIFDATAAAGTPRTKSGH